MRLTNSKDLLFVMIAIFHFLFLFCTTLFVHILLQQKTEWKSELGVDCVVFVKKVFRRLDLTWYVNWRETRVNDSHTCTYTVNFPCKKNQQFYFDFPTKGSSAFSATLKEKNCFIFIFIFTTVAAFSLALLVVWTISLIINKTFSISTTTEL